MYSNYIYSMSIISNFDIEDLAKSLNLPLVGIFSKNKLPKQKLDGYYIVNLQDDSDKYGNSLPGTHWTCFIIKGKHAIYFDSYGFICPKQVQKFLKGYKTFYNIQQIQDIKAICCGWYSVGCCHYIHKSTGSLENKLIEYIKMFGEKDLKHNDKILENYFNKNLKRSLTHN